MKKTRIFSFILLMLLCGCQKATNPLAIKRIDIDLIKETLNDNVPKEIETTTKENITPSPTATPATITQPVIDPTEPSVEMIEEVALETTNSGYSGKAYGSAGRIRVPSVGIDTGLNWMDLEATNPKTDGGVSPAQWAVDAQDSAAYMNVAGYTVICDHAAQGFSGIIGLPIGSEICIDNTDGSTSTYHVYASFAADNSDGYMMYNGAYSYDGINLYTCTDGTGNNVWVLQAN